MHNIFLVLLKFFPHLNKREITEDDLWEFVKRYEIRVERRLLIVNGYYGRYKPKHKQKPRGLILIDETLRQFEFLKTFLHEVGHFCLHEPSGIEAVLFSKTTPHTESKQDKEADFFMLLALIPQKLLFELSRTPFDELHPFTQELLIRRKAVWDLYKI